MASSSLSCQRSSSIPNQFLIELNASGDYKLTPSGYQTLHKMIIYDEVASGIFSGRYETPYLRYDGINTLPLTGMVSGILSSTSAGVITGFKIDVTGIKSGILKNIASVQTKLNPSTKIELKTIFKDTNEYLYENEYDGAQILNLIDVNYSNANGLSTFQKTSKEIFREALCCKNFEIGIIKFAGKDNLELFNFTTDEASLVNYIQNLRPVEKNYPGSAINQALDMAATVNWKSNKTKIVNIISNNKPYIEKNDMYSCCKNDANFPIDIKTEIDEVLDKVTVLRNKGITVNTFVVDGFYESSFALVLSSSSRSSSSLGKAQPSLSFPSSSSFSDSSCPCSINVTRTSFDCDPCCGIKDAFEDGYKYESLIHLNGLEQVCCPPCPDGYYREDIYYDPEFGCFNCIPIDSSSSIPSSSYSANSSSSSRRSSSSSRTSSSSSSKSWLSKSSSSFNVIKSSSSSSQTFTTINCQQISREEKCCKDYYKCDSSFAPRGIRCNTSSESFSSCSCILSSANCPKPCPCSIDDYGINLDLDVDNQQGTCAAGPEVVNLKWNITMSDKKYTSKYLPPEPGSIIPSNNPDYICGKRPISNVVTLSTCQRYPTICDTFMADDSPLGGKFVILHPNLLDLQLNYVILNLCDGSNIFNKIFTRGLSACAAFTQNGTQYLNKDSWSIGVLYGVWGYNIKYWISWNGGILKNEIKEKEIRFGGMIECTDANKDLWSTWRDTKCCCSSSSCDTENDPKCTTTTTTTTPRPNSGGSGATGATAQVLNIMKQSKKSI